MKRFVIACGLALILGTPAAWGAGMPAASAVDLSLGWRFADGDGHPGRAAEYLKLQDSVTLTGKVASFKGARHFYLDADYLNPDDYTGDIRYDEGGLLRFDLFGESLYHNLDHIPYPSPGMAVTSPTGSLPMSRDDRNPGENYHVEVRQNQVHVRGKLPLYPLHVNLTYWRLDRRGRKQLRYLDESCNGCHQHSRTLGIDRTTEEFTGSIDAHLGPVDLILEQLVRLFRDQEASPVDAFDHHDYRTVNDGALLVHDETPDAKLVASTLKAHTSLAGGLNGAAAVTFGSRTNQSKLKTIGPVEAQTDFVKSSADVTYIPLPQLTVNLRYRLLDMDSSNTGTQVLSDLAVAPNVPGSDALASVPVRAALDLTTASYAATATWRPARFISVKGDFRREDLQRGNTGTAGEDGVWELPRQETRNRYRLGTYLHPTRLRGLRINTWYQYRSAEDPAYATTIATGHEGFASLTWAASPNWGLSLEGRLALARNRDRSIFQEADSTGTLFTRYPIHRRSEDDHLGAGAWFTLGRVNCSLNYGYIRNRIVQDLIFGMDTVNNLTVADNAVDYVQHLHSAILAANWQVVKTLRLSAEGHLFWSKGRFAPEFDTQLSGFAQDPATLYPVTSNELRDLSAFDLRKSGLLVGVDWTPRQGWIWSARYGFDDYDDRLGDAFDGSAQTVTVSLAKSW